jgi:hypothetical protein
VCFICRTFFLKHSLTQWHEHVTILYQAVDSFFYYSLFLATVMIFLFLFLKVIYKALYGVTLFCLSVRLYMIFWHFFVRVGTGGRFFETLWWTFGLHKLRAVLGLAENGVSLWRTLVLSWSKYVSNVMGLAGFFR